MTMGDTTRNDETWVPTTCYGCFPSCAIKVKRKDGHVVASKGNPDVFSSLGKCCGKSIARVADYYHPNRVLKPMRRTNPEKGIGVDPMWEEISYEEAMDVIVEKLKKIQAEDPRKLVLGSMDLCNGYFSWCFGEAFGSPNMDWLGATWCGGGLHSNFLTLLGTINSEPDLERCNYFIQWGSQLGTGANNNPTVAMRNLAAARKRGMRVVVVDPIFSHAAAKADEWIPIIPGTDAALALAICNLLVNEYGLYDAEFLKKKTNAAYLIGPDQHYVRHPETGEPQIWDPEAGEAKQYEAKDIQDFALEGTYEVNGVECRPAFVLMKDNFTKYDVETASAITSVPGETIRRIAKEFGEAAQIGGVIEMSGHTLPLRPAAVETKRGGTTHKNAYWNVFSINLINILVGAMNVPGGLLGTNAFGPYGLWQVSKSKDGLIETNIFDLARMVGYIKPYPPRKVKPPENLNLEHLLPCTAFLNTTPLYPIHDHEKFCMPYKPEMLFVFLFNPMMTAMDPRAVEHALKNIDFIVGFAWQIDETQEFADIILPHAHDFERWWPFPANQPAGFIAPGPGPWYAQVFQPVVDAPPDVRNWGDIMMELAERLGILDKMNIALNKLTNLRTMPHLKLAKNKRYTVEDICKKGIAMMANEEITEEWFLEKGTLDLYDKMIEEAFPGPFMDARIPVYFEHFIDAGKEVERVTRELGMDWWETTSYHPLPEYHACRAHQLGDDEYDLYICNSKLPLIGHSHGSENAWIDDVITKNRLDYFIMLHPSAAEPKGIKDGDEIWVESEIAKIKGRVRVTECVHPKVLGFLGLFGRWAQKKTIAKGKGAHMNSLIRFDWDMVDTLSGQIDYCAKVKVYKA
jgi:anaerobic selenocysteine-containing dehydrogenase